MPSPKNLVTMLARVLPQGWTLQECRESGRDSYASDFVLRGPQRRRIAVAYKARSSSRMEELKGLLALHHLEAAAAGMGGDALLLVQVPTVSEKAMATLAAWAERCAPQLSWGIIGSDGSHVLKVFSGPELAASQPLEAPLAAITTHRAQASFTLANQKLLKMVLFAQADPRMWGGPRLSRWNGNKLAQLVGIGDSTVSKFRQAFEAAGFLQISPLRGAPWQLKNHRRLFQLWSSSWAQMEHEVTFARPLFTSPKALRIALAQGTIDASPPLPCFGGPYAAQIHGIRYVYAAGADNDPLDLWWTGPINDCIERHELEVLPGPAGAELRIHGGSAAEVACFGAVQAGAKGYVVDPLQVALESASKGPREFEEAERIFAMLAESPQQVKSPQLGKSPQ